jgi:hypothetical protein
MGQLLSKAIGVFIEFGIRRFAAVAVLALGTIPVLYGVSPAHTSARNIGATASAADATVDLTPRGDFAGAAADAANEPATATAVDTDAVRAENEPAARPLYPYSVVPGGIHSADELRAAAGSDGAVGLHYAGLNISKARVERLAAAKLAYVSYRRGENIFWTRNEVLLPKGERVVTDGTVMLRARCGNRISEVPMAPVEALNAAVPPEAMELPPADVIAAPDGLPEAEVPLAPTPETAILIPPDVPVPGAPYVPPVGFGPPLNWVPTGGGTPSTGGTTPSGPTGPGGPSGPSGPTGPGGGTPPPVITPPGGPSGPNGGTPPPPPPIPAPEPGEFAMVAAGVAAVATVAALRKKRVA